MNIGANIIKFDCVNSTNLYLNQLLKDKAVEEGTVVLADEQTAGRGQIENTWESTQGENILMSFVLYPTFLLADSQFMLSKFVSLGIYDFLVNYLENVSIKWPNDIYVGNKKIAGVLIENSLRGTSISNSIVGIGLNINQTEFSSSIPNPTSIKIETGKQNDLTRLIEELFESLRYWYNILLGGNYKALNAGYLNALYQFGELCHYSDGIGQFKATITNIDKDGKLCMMDSESKSRKYAFKEVKFL